jgi:hypothetical protein
VLLRREESIVSIIRIPAQHGVLVALFQPVAQSKEQWEAGLRGNKADFFVIN